MQIVVLGAGKGTRMKADIPKVLVPFLGRPIIMCLLDSIYTFNSPLDPIVVVGYMSGLVRKTLGDDVTYVEQTEQLGTGHAVACTEIEIQKRNPDYVMILLGDHPFLKLNSLNMIADKIESTGADLVMGTVYVPDFEGWRNAFQSWGRIIRNTDGSIHKIQEYRDCNDDEKKCLEVNPLFMCFKTDVLFRELKECTNENTQGEYYLTSVVASLDAKGSLIETVPIEASEAIGINTAEELMRAEEFFNSEM